MRRVLLYWFLVAGLACAADSKPNVLFIAIDDLNDWVGCLGGHPDVKTPNIDALAKRGVLFTNAHCVSPICGPSRAAVLTGRRPETTGVYTNKGSYLDYVDESVVPLPMYLRQNGYHTLGAGKINHAFTKVDDRNWDEYGPSSGHIGGPFTVEELSTAGDDYPGRRIKRGKIDVTLPMNGISTLIDRPANTASTFDWGGLNLEDDEMPDGEVAAWGVKQLRRDFDKPFFLAIGIYRPHQPLFAPQKYFDLYDTKAVSLPKVMKDDLDDVPVPGRYLARKGWTSGCHETVLKYNQWREAVEGYLASVSFADAQVGRLMKALDAGKHAGNTLVVLWSDHGWHLGEKEHWGKHTPWTRSTRVPLIVVPPKRFGVKAGMRSADPVSLLDLYPTILEACGLKRAPGIEGRSLLPRMKSGHSALSGPAISTIGRGTHSAVTGKWRYIRWFDGSEELYDLEADPEEFRNRAGEVSQREMMDSFHAVLPIDKRFKRFARLGSVKVVEEANGELLLFDFEAAAGISEQNDVSAERPELVKKVRALLEKAGSERRVVLEE